MIELDMVDSIVNGLKNNLSVVDTCLIKRHGNGLEKEKFERGHYKSNNLTV